MAWGSICRWNRPSAVATCARNRVGTDVPLGAPIPTAEDGRCRWLFTRTPASGDRPSIAAGDCVGDLVQQRTLIEIAIKILFEQLGLSTEPADAACGVVRGDADGRM